LQGVPTPPKSAAVEQIPKTLPMAEPEAMGAVGETAAGGMAAAAGPLAAVAIVAQMFNAAVQEAVKAVGSFAVTMVSAESTAPEMVGDMGEAVKGIGDKLGFFGAALSEAGQGLIVFSDLVKALNGMADRYTPYSPTLAVAEAMADMRQTLGDLRRGREVGPELSKFINEQTILQQQFENEKIKMMKVLLPVVTGGMKMLVDLLPVMSANIKLLALFLLPLKAFMDWLHKTKDADDSDIDWSTPTADALYAEPFKYGREGTQQSPGGP
jgi:hypothetical protein